MRLTPDASGVFPIAPTPFNPDGSIDWNSADRLFEFYHDIGSDGVTVLGINGVSIKKGCTSAVHQETSVNRAMIENSGGKVIVVADHTKMNCVSSFLTCPLSRIDTIVTDWMAPASFCQELEEAGLSVVQVSDEI